jgi:chorismate mutase
VDDSAAETIAEFRRLIAEVDAAVVASVNRRIELIAELKRFKEARGVAFVDPEQERHLLAELAKANPGALSEEGLLDVVAAITRGHEAGGRRPRGAFELTLGARRVSFLMMTPAFRIWAWPWRSERGGSLRSA